MGELDKFSKLVLKNFPRPIALIFSLMQTSTNWEEKTRLGFQLFEFSLRYYTLLAASQYLYKTKGVKDSRIDTNLLNFLQVGEKTLGLIQETLFSILKVQQGHKDQFYIKEMYDWYWDISHTPHRPNKGVGKAFGEIIQLRNKIIHFKVIPQSENEWKEYYSQLYVLLNKSLGTLFFLENYRLVRIDSIENGIIQCKDFTGIDPANDPIKVKLQENDNIPGGGWLCISRLQPEYLQVHPLIIFLQNDDLESAGDIALLENFNTREATYAQPNFGNLRNIDIISDVLRFVRTVLEERIGQLIEFETLNWDSFREATKIVTAQKTSLLQDKFKSDLYLQREVVLAEFERFIDSNKTALVLIGNSGVGKSSFLTSIIKDLSNNDDFSILAYDGANLDSSQRIENIIDNDLKGIIRRRGHSGVSYLDDLPLRSNLDNKKVLILIDAINENGSPRDLLFNINRFIIDYSRYRWLKILVTSRPQAWRMMKRGVKLSDPSYYYPKNELDPWIELLPFTWNEVPKVYENYRQKYQINTKYEELKTEIKVNLRDPLFLLLVSQTWKGTDIPTRLSNFQVYEKYLDTLIQEKVLQLADLDFLEEEIMPRFINWEKFQPSIPRRDLQSAYTTDGRPLLELIENRDYAGDTPVNISFVHLVDVGLLEQRGIQRDYEIRFKYERFFDYFVGKQLHKIVKNNKEIDDTYRMLLQNTLRQPWLWGGVKNSLILELLEKKYDLVVELIRTEDAYIKDLLVVVLEEFGEENKGIVTKLLTSIQLSRKSKWIPRRKKKSLSEQTASKGVIEVAYRLDLLDVIRTGCFDNDPAVRSTSIQQLWRYWREKNREDGFGAIQELISRSIRFPRWSFDGLESAVSVSLLILFENSRDQIVTERLRSIWKPVMQKALLATPVKSITTRRFQSQIRSAIPVFAGNVFARLTRSGAEVKYWLNLQEIQDFFSLSEEQKKSCKKVIPYIDPSVGDLDEIYEDVLEVAKSSNVITWYLLVCAFVPQAAQKPQKMISLMERLFSDLIVIKPVPPAIVLPTDLFAYGIDSNLYEKNPSWLESFGEMAWKFIYIHNTKFTSRVGEYQYLMAGLYFDKYYQLYKSTKSEFQTRYLDHIIQSADPGLIRSYTRSFAVSAVLKIPPRVAMQALLPIVDFWREKVDLPESDVVEEILIEAFSIIRNFKPLDVDDFMLENDFPQSLQQRVKSNTIEKLGNVIGLAGTRFVMDAFLAHPSRDRRDMIQLVFTEAFSSKSMNVWLGKLIKIILNAIYGDTLFRI